MSHAEALVTVGAGTAIRAAARAAAVVALTSSAPGPSTKAARSTLGTVVTKVSSAAAAAYNPAVCGALCAGWTLRSGTTAASASTTVCGQITATGPVAGPRRPGARLRSPGPG